MYYFSTYTIGYTLKTCKICDYQLGDYLPDEPGDDHCCDRLAEKIKELNDKYQLRLTAVKYSNTQMIYSFQPSHTILLQGMDAKSDHQSIPDHRHVDQQRMMDTLDQYADFSDLGLFFQSVAYEGVCL